MNPRRQYLKKSKREKDAAVLSQEKDEGVMQQEIDRILTRLDTEIPEAQKRMDELLTRLRTSRLTSAA
jgi:hypothetical protein